MTASAHNKPLVALQNQRVKNGEVLFSSPSDIIRLKALIEHVNTGGKMADIIGKSGVPEYIVEERVTSDFDGSDIRDLSEVLEGYVENGRPGWDTARCPVHGAPGSSTDSLHINRKSGKYHCIALKCDTREIYAEVMRRAKEAGLIGTEE